jgi:hypothetical protein
MTTNDLAWAPDACTLPTVQRPLRLAEFDDLFAAAVRAVDRATPMHTRLRLSGAIGLDATVRDLTARETACCSFFDFAITPGTAADGEALVLDVRVPAQYADVLAALSTRASSASVGRD